MKALLAAAMACVLAPLAAAFAAAGSAPAPEPDADAATHAWITAARRAARPNMQDILDVPARPAGLATSPAPADEPPMAAETLADPFGLVSPEVSTEERHGRRRPAAEAPADDDAQTTPPAPAAPPTIRVLGTLLQADDACAVLQIDGASYRVRVGDTLPAPLGRVLKIAEDSVEISAAGAPRLLALDSAEARAAPAPAPAPGVTSRRTGRPRLLTPGARG